MKLLDQHKWQSVTQVIVNKGDGAEAAPRAAPFAPPGWGSALKSSISGATSFERPRRGRRSGSERVNEQIRNSSTTAALCRGHIRETQGRSLWPVLRPKGIAESSMLCHMRRLYYRASHG